MIAEELDDVTHGRVERLSSEGNALVEAGDLAGALKMYERALKLLPEPIHRWEAATWLFTALARCTLSTAQVPGGEGHPQRGHALSQRDP